MDWVVAIPSYRRAQTIHRKTLALLWSSGIPAERVTVFVASPEEAEEYAQYFLPSFSPSIVVGVPGIHRQRAFMESYYQKGQRVVFIDDDVSALKMIHPAALPEVIDRCFELAAAEGCALWGINPTDNGLCLKDEAVVGLRYIIGAFYGLTITHDIDYPWPVAEDYTRTVEHFKRDGRVLRFNGIGPTTRYFATGGLEETRAAGVQEPQMIEFVERYSDLATLRKRSGKPTDARFKIITYKRIEHPFGP